ncbi:N-6 DNA methylase [Adlercreutzia aquisgranensis]|uniref:N-6 DNA methylase n=1 Tax=Adlercreutzia aquisgranensis TaxID=2941323 RepID=UPI00203E8A5C|nr:N-6 DNA methylase [Adlercreutzia aquisgranensis]
MMQVDKSSVIQPETILDFIDGTTQRKDTPEERVRQEILKSLVREYGYKKDQIEVEYSIKFGSSRKAVDAAIWKPGQAHTQEGIYIIVECKDPKTKSRGRKDGVDQLHSYASACMNSTYGMWTNGDELLTFRYVIDKSDKRVPDPVPDLPHAGGEVPNDAPRFDQLRPAASDSLLYSFRRCHNYIAGNQGIQKAEAFLELLKIIFCKIQDERDSSSPTFYITPAERQGAAGKKKCRKRIEKLFESVKQSYETIFKGDEQIGLTDDVLAYIVSRLQMYSLLESDVDVKGHAYETIVGSNLRGDKGQFFTPRNMCQMMVRMVDPDEDDVILDPAMGTCGFLVTGMNYVLEKIGESVEASGRSKEGKKQALDGRKKNFLARHIVGIDFDPILVRASKMNMVMNNDGTGQLFHANSLEPFSFFSPELQKALRLDAQDVKENKALQEGHGVTAIMTNPPFGSKIPIEDPVILETFDLGHSWSYVEDDLEWVMDSKLVSRPPEILFIERCIRLLEPGVGVAALVIPNGILGNPGLGYVRQWILRHAKILGSIDMHPDAFQPNVGVQTSVLVLRRWDRDEEAYCKDGTFQDYKIFMAICDHVGHDKRGQTTYVRDDEGYPIVREQTTAVTGIVASDEENEHASKERVIDDETMAIANAFLEWRRDQ